MADLHGLNLLRNDPGVAARVLAQAEQGDIDAEVLRRLVAADTDDAEFADARRLVRLYGRVTQRPGDAGEPSRH